MPYTKEQKKEWSRLYYLKNKEKKQKQSREHYIKNKEEIKIRHKIWNETNKDYLKSYTQKYYVDNKERIKETNKKYKQNNKEKISIYNKKYWQTDSGRKIMTIAQWKVEGLIDEYEKVYERYEYTLFCDECRCDLDQCTKSVKVMDHDHETGLFRNILCTSCNVKRG